MAALQRCFNGAASLVQSGCEPFDLDGDGDAEHDDLAAVLCGFNGPNVPVVRITVVTPPPVTSDSIATLSGTTSGAAIVEVLGG